jgi:hypothetical protein
LTHIFFTQFQKIRISRKSRKRAPPTIEIVRTGWFAMASRSFPNWKSNEPSIAMKR